MIGKNKDGPAVRIIPPLVPLLTIALGVLLDRKWVLGIGFELPAAVRYWSGGLIIIGAILILGLWSVVLFRRSGESEIPWTPTTGIVVRGPYGFTRNPMYLQFVIVCIGTAILLWNMWILLLTPLGMWLLQRFAIMPEEAYLEDRFGNAYREYKRRVRRWI